MPVYEVLPVGKPFGNRAPGSLVTLTEAEASGFLDKLRAVDGDDPQPVPAPAEQAEQGATGDDGTETRKRRRKRTEAQ